jgi:Niemann-Pick C2 protein
VQLARSLRLRTVVGRDMTLPRFKAAALGPLEKAAIVANLATHTQPLRRVLGRQAPAAASLALAGLMTFVPSASASPFTVCSETTMSGTLQAVNVNGCSDEAERCVLKRGEDATVTMSFVSGAATDFVHANWFGVIGGELTPYALPDSDACLNSGLNCPLVQDQNYTYEQTAPVPQEYPQGDSELRVELQAPGHDEMLVCAVIPVTVQ